MAITLGRNGSLSAPFGDNIINVTKTVEQETIDVSNRSNTGEGYKVFQPGFSMVTWEIECHDPSTAMTALAAAGGGCTVLSVTENIAVDGAVTFTISAKGGS
jgi:hypothetical protein